ncbi:PTS fructose transporter subunit IIB [Haloferax sp. DFSO52]|uniref:PTS fructose transporter subunit IIB n=1 Tax=Haloferax sp. DFSO52 TaxID=3388505 RepID=UPI003A896930
MKLVAITSCPTGIAHSQMAAENLLQAGERLGHDIDVEVQGAMGTQDELTSDAIAEADAVIIASDTSVSRDRFGGKLVVKGTVKDGVNKAEEIIERAVELAEAGKTGSVTFGSSAAVDDAEDGSTEETTSGTEADEPARVGGNPEKGLFARLKKLFS